jgi:hypothetical protein
MFASSYTYDVMIIAIPEDEWNRFQRMNTERFIQTLQQLAAKVDLAKFQKHKRGPKKPRQKRTQNSKQPHVSTARLLKG